MSINFKKYKDNLLFVPLGGANEIGMNLNAYHYDGKWLLIDLGIGFAGMEYPGVDIVVPDISFLIEQKDNIVGILLTHAHEDHLGGMQYLWNELKCPVYTTKFTATILEAKFREMSKDFSNLKICNISEGEKIQIGPFLVEPVGITHSIPEMHGVAIHTEMGTVFHTGDWKLDKDPVVGSNTNEDRLKEIGEEGVLALVCDSTNIFNSGISGSEGDLRESLHLIIAGLNRKLVVVTTFASNIARLHSIASAAQACGRKVVLMGRALHRIYEAAKSTGYLNDLDPFIPESQIARYKRHELLVICTGCQGEELAAASKLASNSHRYLALNKGDAVIFSSKIIPGNEKKIFALFNKFVNMGVEVMTERDHFVHVSGHPSRDEVEMMYNMIKPKISIPVHGEPTHLHEHAKFARNLGVQAIEPHNGIVICISDEGAEKIGEVHNGYLAIDGHFIVPTTSSIFYERRKMMHGAVVVTLICDSRNKLIKSSISAPGSMNEKEDMDLFEQMYGIIDNICDVVISGDVVRKLSNALRKFLKAEIGKEPYISVKSITMQ